MGEKSSKTDLRLSCNRTSLKYMLDTLDENGLGQSTTGTGGKQGESVRIHGWGEDCFFVLSTTYLNKLADKVWRPGMFVGIGIWEWKCTHGCYPTFCKLQWGLVLIFCWFKVVLPCLSFSKITYMAMTFQPEKNIVCKASLWVNLYGSLSRGADNGTTCTWSWARWLGWVVGGGDQ